MMVTKKRYSVIFAVTGMGDLILIDGKPLGEDLLGMMDIGELFDYDYSCFGESLLNVKDFEWIKDNPGVYIGKILVIGGSERCQDGVEYFLDIRLEDINRMDIDY